MPLSSSTAVVGVVPAAGYGRRLGRKPCSKEVLLVGGRPVIDYLLDRLVRAGCTEIRVVARPEKTDVVAHARGRGALVVTGHPDSVAESLLLGLRGLGNDDIVLFGFPDTLWEPDDGFVVLAECVRSGTDLVLGLFEGREPERADVVQLSATGVVTSVAVKPRQPSSSIVWGCGAARARILWGLEAFSEPGSYFDSLAREGMVKGIVLSDSYIDIGTPNALREAAG